MRILHLRPRPLIAGMVFGLALIGASPASAQELSVDEQAIHDVVVRFHGALAAGDSATIAELLAPDAVILESGGVESRSDYLSGHMRTDMRYEQSISREQTSMQISIEGNTAWAAATGRNTRESAEPVTVSNSAELMILTRVSAGWRIRAIHWSSRANRG